MDVFRQSNSPILNVGIIGLGEVAQVIHLPVLETMPERFRIAALCDASHMLTQHMGAKYRVDRLYTDAHELVKQSDLDVIFILNSDEYHADCAIAAAEQTKHVFIEKPMCLTLSDADAIIEVQKRTGVKVMVGYMRRYAPAFEEAVKEVGGLANIRYARVRDIIGPNRYFIQPTSPVVSYPDIPDEFKADRRLRGERMVHEATGLHPSSPLFGLYRFLCGLSSHDLSAMREVLGMPNGIAGAKASFGEGGPFLSAIFDYGAFAVNFETGVNGQGRFDAHVEVYAHSKSVKVQYNTPYIRHLPTTVHISETQGEAYKESVLRPTLTDPYTIELKALHASITEDQTPKTTPEDYKKDLLLFRMLIEALQKNEQ